VHGFPLRVAIDSKRNLAVPVYYATMRAFIQSLPSLVILCLAPACHLLPSADAQGPAMSDKSAKVYPVQHTDAEWRKLLTPEEYKVLRQEGTEPPFHNAYFDAHKKGVYVCAACGQVLFSSDDKFESGTGWPSFWEPVDPTHVEEVTDGTLGMRRTEVRCSRCGSHLGHVFDDGPKPTGLRYCMNSAALKLQETAAK
jgi:peptide-methionine (R)-S-oxide reductase